MDPPDVPGALWAGSRLTRCAIVRCTTIAILAAALGDARPATSQAAAPAGARRDTLRIIHVGDINLGRTAGRRILRGAGDSVFKGVKDALTAADVAIGNLESPLVDRGDTTDLRNSMVFSGPKQGAAVLAAAGFDIMATSNNHSWDRGERGLLQSIAHLDSAGVAHAGTGRDRDEAWRPALVRRRGWTIAVFSMTRIFNGPGMNLQGLGPACCIAWADTARFREAARLAREALGADLVIVSIHLGVEYKAVPRAKDIEFTRALVRGGADAVIGHHPHVPQGMEWYQGKPIIHSLGNFVFLQTAPWTRRGLWAELTVAPDKAIAVRLRPVEATLTPRFARGRDSLDVARHVDSLTRQLTHRLARPAATRQPAPARPRP